jgi:serine/threonine protein kinase
LLVSPDTFGRRLSAGVGTVTYSSPEQLHGSAYDLKVLPLWQIEKGRPRSCSIVLQQLHFLQSDMFSLGIVMYELLSPFATEMERAVCLSGLRSGRICPEFSMRYPAHARIIGKLLKSEAKERPVARDVLSSDIFVNKDQVGFRKT